MKEGEYRVFNLLDTEEMAEAAAFVNGQIAQTKRDLELVRQADRALAEIDRLLAMMRELAESSTCEGADRKALEQKFDSCRMRIDLIATQYRAALTPAAADRIRCLLATLNTVLF